MAVSPLVTTAGASDANAYVSLVNADQYHDDRPSNGSTTWSGAGNDAKNAAILWATKLLDSLIEWTGAVVNDDQALLWPRTGMIKRSGYSVPSTSIPQELEDACAEFARQLIADDRAADSDVETRGITMIKAGPVTLQFKEGQSAKVVPDAVVNLLPPSWVRRVRGRAAGTRELVRA